jgi:chromate transporter
LVIAIVLQALWRLGKSAIKSRPLAAVGGLALIGCFLGVSPLMVLVATALIASGIYLTAQQPKVETPTPALLIASLPVTATAPAAVTAAGLGGIFTAFAKIGCIVFGSGYVLLAFLRADLVVHRHWLTETQLLDAVAVGQVTPGPVFTTATFIGYILGGPTGATVATVGIFSPAFVFVAVAGPFIQKLRRSKLAGMLLDYLNAASLALMANVTCELARSALIDRTTIALAISSAIVLITLKINSTWLIAGGAVIGVLLRFGGMR